MNEPEVHRTGTGSPPAAGYLTPGPEKDRQFITFALAEEIRDPYSGVPQGVRFTRAACDEAFADVSEEALDSIARRLGDEELTTAYLHMLVSAVYHREPAPMLSNLDLFFEADPDESRTDSVWRSDRAASHDTLASLIRGLGEYRHLGFAVTDDYRSATAAVQGQARTLIAISRMIFDDYRNPVDGVPVPLKRGVDSEGQSTLFLGDDRLVVCLLEHYREFDELVRVIVERDTTDPDVLQEVMSTCSALRDGAL